VGRSSSSSSASTDFTAVDVNVNVGGVCVVNDDSCLIPHREHFKPNSKLGKFFIPQTLHNQLLSPPSVAIVVVVVLVLIVVVVT